MQRAHQGLRISRTKTLNLREKRRVLYTPVEMVALLDSLSRGTLNESQRETLHSLRQGILALAG